MFFSLSPDHSGIHFQWPLNCLYLPPPLAEDVMLSVPSVCLSACVATQRCRCEVQKLQHGYWCVGALLELVPHFLLIDFLYFFIFSYSISIYLKSEGPTLKVSLCVLYGSLFALQRQNWGMNTASGQEREVHKRWGVFMASWTTPHMLTPEHTVHYNRIM